jgi:hypothetical protein
MIDKETGGSKTCMPSDLLSRLIPVTVSAAITSTAWLASHAFDPLVPRLNPQPCAMSVYSFRERSRRQPDILDIDGLGSDSDSVGGSDSGSDDSSNEEDEQEDLSVTRLMGEKDSFEVAELHEYSFQLWVEIEGKEAKVYSQNEEISNGCQGWIVSEVGKVSNSA